MTLQHVKPHGALYLDAVETPETARAVAQAILSLDPDLRFVALAGKRGDHAADGRRAGAEGGV